MSVVLLMDFNSGPANSEKDHSGHGNDGVISGAVRVPGPICQALSFNGIDDYVNCGNIHQNRISILAWVKRIGAQVDNAYIVQQPYTSFVSPYNEYVLGMSTGQKVRFGVTTGGVRTLCISANPIPEEWIHLAGVYDGENVILYINGVAETPVNKTGDINDYGMSLWIGRIETTSGYAFKGIIDEVLIDTQAWLAEKIKKYFNSKKREYGL